MLLQRTQGYYKTSVLVDRRVSLRRYQRRPVRPDKPDELDPLLGATDPAGAAALAPPSDPTTGRSPVKPLPDPTKPVTVSRGMTLARLPRPEPDVPEPVTPESTGFRN